MATVRIRSGFLRITSPTGVPAMAALANSATTAAPAPQSQRESKRLGQLRLLIGIVALLAAVGLAFWFDQAFPDSAFPTPLPAPVEGLALFAVFYVAAQAIERLLEPVSRVLLAKEGHADNYAARLDEAEKAVAAWSVVIGDGTKSADEKSAAKSTAESALEAAAKAKAALEGRHGDRVLLFWFLATGIAIWASAVLHLYFLKAVGIATGSRWIEILATGLIVGGGTKPLHDLITLISQKAETAESPEEEEGATTSSS